jgi:hypothetical protein
MVDKEQIDKLIMSRKGTAGAGSFKRGNSL